LQIFMTTTASHCKGMWNLCVILALVENKLVRVDAAAPKTYVLPFDIKSHGSGVHPDLNVSDFSRKVFSGKLLDFYSFNIAEGAS